MTMEEIGNIAKSISQINDNNSFSDVVSKLGGYSAENLIYYFCNFWSCIPNEHLFEAYADCLTMCETHSNYDFFFKKDILTKVHQLNKHNTIDNAKLQSQLDSDERLTVYHGHCKPTMRGSNSWTLDKDIAMFFGKRNALFSKVSDFYVVTGKVALKSIIAFIDDREEQEVVVLQGNVKNQKKEFFKA